MGTPNKFVISPGGQSGLRMCGAVVFSLLLSGCVAGSLNPAEDLTSSVLSLDAAEPTSETLLAEIGGSNPGTDVTIPSGKPVTTQSDQATQMALVNAGNGETVAAIRAASVISATTETASASAINQPTTTGNLIPPVEKKTTPEQKLKKPASKNLFALLFANNQQNQPRNRNTKPVNSAATSGRSKGNARKVAVFRPVGNSNLPGVRKMGLFGIYDAREGEEEGYSNPLLVASVGGLARTSPNGLRVQTSSVQVACLSPKLVGVIKQIQRRYRQIPIVTSGYRSPARNRQVRGARNSLHIYCKAADIQVPGVSKWALAKYLRTIPGRGGVGTYCYTNSVHIDVGSKRDWNWRCRRGKRKRRG